MVFHRVCKRCGNVYSTFFRYSHVCLKCRFPKKHNRFPERPLHKVISELREKIL
jgi:ribosomal protein L37E